ncbi:MAG: 50S ribosomal protein L23 [bacterium]|nr:50S ribosomal protein L23 [bacterium]
MGINDVIIRPVISEKSLTQAQLGEYTFEVGLAASKGEIKNAFKKAFDVDVVTVRTITTKGKTSRVWGRRERAVQSPVKKAVVILKKGQKLDSFEVKAS